mgnify:CR=1 FL=1
MDNLGISIIFLIASCITGALMMILPLLLIVYRSKYSIKRFYSVRVKYKGYDWGIFINLTYERAKMYVKQYNLNKDYKAKLIKELWVIKNGVQKKIKLY